MKKKYIIIFLLLIANFLTLCSCGSGLMSDSPNKNNMIQQNKDADLPEYFTIDKIKEAMLEHINYELYLYPKKIFDDASDKDFFFDDHIGKSINLEIRIYNSNNPLYTVLVKMEGEESLFAIKEKRGFIFCDGMISKGDYYWPKNTEKYKVVEKYNLIVTQPHKPNYGTSERKNKMIAAFESKIIDACKDFYIGGDKLYTEWENVDVYIVNFYEYEDGAIAWLCSQDGSITNYPVAFQEKNGEIYIQSVKGYTIKNKAQFNEFGRYQFETDIKDAIKHFKCNIK